MNGDQISALELAGLMEQKKDFFLLDVRSLQEHQQYNMGGYLIPLPELMMRLPEIPTHMLIIVYCRSGHRSQIALELLQQAGFPQLKNLTGGVLAWLQQEACANYS